MCSGVCSRAHEGSFDSFGCEGVVGQQAGEEGSCCSCGVGCCDRMSDMRGSAYGAGGLSGSPAGAGEGEEAGWLTRA